TLLRAGQATRTARAAHYARPARLAEDRWRAARRRTRDRRADPAARGHIPRAGMIEFLRFTIPVLAIGAIAFAVANRRVGPAVRRARWIKFATYVVLVHLGL